MDTSVYLGTWIITRQPSLLQYETTSINFIENLDREEGEEGSYVTPSFRL